MSRRFHLLLAVFGLLSMDLAALAGPPAPAPTDAVTDTYFGTTVADPYRWMESDKDRFEAFLKEQNTYARDVLQAIPGREALVKRAQELSSAGTVVYQVTIGGPDIFYFKLAPDDQTPRLFVRHGLAGKERLLADTSTMGSADQHFVIDWFVPSLDGRYVAYGVSSGGSEDSVLHIVRTADAKQLPEAIVGARFGVTAWLPDNRTFLYVRLQPMAPGAPPGTKYEKSKLYEHVVGRSPDGASDPAVFGYGVNADVPVDDNEISLVAYSPASPYLLGIVQHFVKNEINLYVAPLAAFHGAQTHWTPVATEADDITGADLHGNDIYLLSHKDASRFKLLKVSAKAPSLADATEVVAPTTAVLRKFAVAKDAVYVQELDAGLGKLLKVPFSGGPNELVPLPFQGSIGEIAIDAQTPGALMKLTSWTEPQLWYRFDPKTNTVADTGLRPRSPVDYSAITSEEVLVKARDGVSVPLSIIHRKDMKLDGSNATILEGYGAYGITLDSGFDPSLLAWLERGGVFAVAHVRGGGEFGEDWHLAGQKLNKVNTINDFVDCAEYLVDRKYTSPAKLAGQGGSAGGITVGGALTQRPALFAAILDDVGVSDTLRAELSENGPTNIPEFGTVTTEDGFKGLYSMSAYAHVKDGTPYPAVMLTTGVHDPRVAPWEVGKMTARLQAATSSAKPIILRVDYDAGHGIGSTKAQLAEERGDQWAFVLWQTGDPAFQPKP